MSLKQKIKDLISPLNISLGFLGIQFAWAIQIGQTSPFLERLGSEPWLTSLIWAAGPVTGVLVQPIVGTLSDNHKSKFGKRRPYLIAGVILTALSLIAMPNSPSLLIAAIILWLMDASINLTQGPYRTLVPDVLDKKQQTLAYALMSLTIGLGSVIAFYIGSKIADVKSLFYLGAIVMIVAMGWTILTTKEKSSLDQDNQAANSTPEAKKESALSVLLTSVTAVKQMPAEGMKLCIAHSFTWFGLMCLFVFFSLYVPRQIFGATDSSLPSYQEGVQWASLCYAAMNTVCFLFSPAITPMSDALGKKAVHTIGLVLMGLSFLSMFFLHTPMEVMIAMGVIGIGWATTLSLPFALLSDHLPKGKEGLLMGTFNIFIAAPGLLCDLVMGPVISMLNEDHKLALMIGGIAILISAVLMQRVYEESAPTSAKLSAA